MNNNNNNIDAQKYLVTQKSDLQTFSKEKINTDLEAITKAELRSRQRVGITMNRKGNTVTRAMGALSLINPFKGV